MFCSKKVGQYGINDDNNETDSSSSQISKISSRQLILQRNIQAFATAFLRDMVLSMPNLPQNDEYVELQNKHKAGFESKIQKERSAAVAAMLKVSDLFRKVTV